MTIRSILLSGWKPGQYVQLHPATDAWMSGDRYGTIVRVGCKYLHVRMDVSRRVLRVSPDNVL